ncbi:MAG: hypothetical protein ABIQ16_19685 [Polyangiaceae bacterium]
MQTLTRTEFFAKPEVKEALENLKSAARGALPEGSFAEREAVLLGLLDEVGRGLLEDELQLLAGSFGELLLVDGVEYKQHEPGLVQYYCLGGTIRVRRCTYRRVDVRNGPTVVPLELVAGLAEGATPALAYNVLHGYGQRDMRQHGESLAAAHRVPPARATLERMAKRLANVVPRGGAARRGARASDGKTPRGGACRLHRVGPNLGADGRGATCRRACEAREKAPETAQT